MTTADQEREYLRTVAELQELARNAPYVTQDWVLAVASMDPDEMRRRLIRSYDWSGHFHHSLDGIEAIRGMGGSGIDGCRSHKEVRAVVLGLLEKIEKLEAARRTPSQPAAVKDSLTDAQPAPAVPAGWRLVPEEPTREMLDAGASEAEDTREIYVSMLAAAPTPTQATA